MASTSPTNQVEDAVKDLLVAEFQDTDNAVVDSLPSEEDIAYLTDYIVRRIDKRYPYLLVIADNSSETSADSTKRMGTDSVPFSVYVAVQFDGPDELSGQRRLATDWCLYVRAALQGQRIDGGNFTSEEAIDGFDQTREFNLEGLALYRCDFLVSINVDLDDTTLP